MGDGILCIQLVGDGVLCIQLVGDGVLCIQLVGDGVLCIQLVSCSIMSICDTCDLLHLRWAPSCFRLFLRNAHLHLHLRSLSPRHLTCMLTLTSHLAYMFFPFSESISSSCILSVATPFLA